MTLEYQELLAIRRLLRSIKETGYCESPMVPQADKEPLIDAFTEILKSEGIEL